MFLVPAKSDCRPGLPHSAKASHAAEWIGASLPLAITIEPQSERRSLLAESGSVCERVLATAIQRDVPGPGGRIFRVLSMPGLMELKSLSERDQDHADAETLRRRIEFDAE